MLRTIAPDSPALHSTDLIIMSYDDGIAAHFPCTTSLASPICVSLFALICWSMLQFWLTNNVRDWKGSSCEVPMWQA